MAFAFPVMRPGVAGGGRWQSQKVPGGLVVACTGGRVACGDDLAAVPGGSRTGRPVPLGRLGGGPGTASEAAARGQSGIALRCAYRAFLDAEAAGAGSALIRVGDLLQSMGVQGYLKVSVRSAYLRAAEHARRGHEWPVMAAAAGRLAAMGEVAEARVLLAEVCSRPAAGRMGVPCDPVRVAATPSLFGKE